MITATESNQSTLDTGKAKSSDSWNLPTENSALGYTQTVESRQEVLMRTLSLLEAGRGGTYLQTCNPSTWKVDAEK